MKRCRECSLLRPVDRLGRCTECASRVGGEMQLRAWIEQLGGERVSELGEGVIAVSPSGCIEVAFGPTRVPLFLRPGWRLAIELPGGFVLRILPEYSCDLNVGNSLTVNAPVSLEQL